MSAISGIKCLGFIMFQPPSLICHMYLAVCIFPSIELNEHLFPQFSQNETIAQTINSNPRSTGSEDSYLAHSRAG